MCGTKEIPRFNGNPDCLGFTLHEHSDDGDFSEYIVVI